MRKSARTPKTFCQIAPDMKGLLAFHPPPTKVGQKEQSFHLFNIFFVHLFISVLQIRSSPSDCLSGPRHGSFLDLFFLLLLLHPSHHSFTIIQGSENKISISLFKLVLSRASFGGCVCVCVCVRECVWVGVGWHGMARVGWVSGLHQKHFPDSTFPCSGTNYACRRNIFFINSY